MKKVIFFLTILILASCSTITGPIDGGSTVIVPKDVEIILSTTQPEYDEIVISYYDFDLGQWVSGPTQFTYDVNGNPEPYIISFPDYAHRKIEGETYRNNSFPSELKVEIYIDGVLVFDKRSYGTDASFAAVNFNYTILD
jgi:hypothetical protein